MTKKCGSFFRGIRGGWKSEEMSTLKEKNTVRTLYVQRGRTEHTYALE